MTTKKTDPRIIRTRRFIMDAFIKVSSKKDFKDITIKDITTEATVNRATFYYHFVDKYDLLEKVLKEDMMVNVIDKIKEHQELNENTIKTVFTAITQFQTSVSALNYCQRNFQSFASTFEVIIKRELEKTFFEILSKQKHDSDQESLRITAALISWGIYGATVDWQQNSTLTAEEYIQLAVPHISNGVNSHYR